MQADEAERWERIKQRKKNPDQGFSDYEAATKRQYDRLTKNMKVDMSEVQNQKTALGEDFYASPSSSLIHGTHKPTTDAVDKMANDLQKQYAVILIYYVYGYITCIES